MLKGKNEVSPVLITGGGFRNKGAEAMLLTVAAALKESGFTVRAHVSESEAAAADEHGLWPTARPLTPNLGRRLSADLEMVRVLRSCRAIVDVGGYQFGDPWGIASVSRKARVLKYVVPRKTPVVYMSQAWGPFEDPEIARRVSVITQRAELCIARDPRSLAFLMGLRGGECKNVVLAPDVAWGFAGRGGGPAEDLSVGNRPIVALAPNYGVFQRAEREGSGKNEYLACFCRLARTIFAGGRDVLLLPHFFGDDGKDDRLVCRLIAECVNAPARVRSVQEVRSASQLKGLLRNCEVLVGSRYHALIAALSQAVPVVAIGWSHKYRELLEECGVAEYSIAVQDGMVGVEDSLRSLLVRRGELSEHLSSRVAELRVRARAGIAEGLRTIQEKCAE